MIRRTAFVLFASMSLLSGCSEADEGVLDIAFIAAPAELFATGSRLSEPAQHLQAATASGLVARDPTGEIVPALADRWIVTDDGLSYIFRLRGGTWPDGSPLSSESARIAFLQAVRQLEGTSMALDLAPVAEVRAMAGRVIELRLSAPFPSLLQLLAQPELALRPSAQSGDMALARQDDVALLALKPPAELTDLEPDSSRHGVRAVRVITFPADAALAAFERGDVDVVLGGTIGTLPLVDTGPLSLGTVRLDPAIGLFGLQVREPRGPLASEEVREGIAMALDRPALIAPFALGGWTPTTRIVTPGVADQALPADERWQGLALEALRAEARSRIARWRASRSDTPPGPVRLTIEIDDEPGYELLFEGLATQLSEIGIRLERARPGQRGDLQIVDRVARYMSPRWFMNQFHCKLDRGVCDEEIDSLVAAAAANRDLGERAVLFAEAERAMLESSFYIPIGTPVRWSLVRGNVGGFMPNPWAFHPLPPMAVVAS